MQHDIFTWALNTALRDVPRFTRVVATLDRRCSIKCVYAHFKGDFVMVGD